MHFDGDDVAGVVDLFGALTRDELGRALGELAFRAGGDDDPDAHADAIDEAVADYFLVAVDDGEELLVPGPVAFPNLPEGAADLPHILDVPERSVDRDAAAERVRERLREEAETVAERGDSERAATLLNVTYDAEAWAALDLSDVRDALDGA
ncbi:MAG: hypothetical protein ABEJ68_06245 [Halobacteriaceae archaeon]